MDKFFIQAAFKSLDDIENDDNIKKSLKESREREASKRKEYLRVCAGDPDVNVDAFNHATDIGGSSPTTGLGESFDDDELWDKYVGKQVTINPDNEKYHDQVGEITDLITSGKSFEDSVWEIYLSQGDRLELLGKELKLSPKTKSVEIKDDTELVESIVLNEDVKDDLKTLDEIQKSLMSQLSEDIKPTKTKFNLRDEEDVKAAQEKLNQKEDTKEKEFVIVHPLNIHKDAKSGDAILQCNNCKETYYLNKDELVSEQGELEQDKIYNLNYQCEHCGSNSGYIYVGDLATQDAQEAKELTAENNNNQSDLEPLDKLPLEPVEEQEEPEEIVEESFDKLINKYGKKIYENLECYKTTSVTQEERNKYIIEGVLTLVNGKQHPTTFLIETLKNSKNKLLFRGGNKDLVESCSPFRFVASIKDKKLIFENMRYRYVEKVENKDYLIEGLEINK